MIRRSWVVVLTILCGMLCGAGLPGQQSRTSYVIEGKVRIGASGKAAENLRVDLQVRTGMAFATTYTRSNGEFEFSNLRAGVYTVVIQQEGYEAIRQVVEIRDFQPAPLFLTLNEPVEKQVTVTGTVVSARELTLPGRARDAWQAGLRKLQRENDPKGSLKEFQKVVKEAPEFYEAYFQIGLAQQQLQQPSAAMESYQRSIEVSGGKYGEAYLALAGLEGNAGEYEDAEKFARKGLELEPNAWIGYFELARALMGQNRVEEALREAEECRMRNPDYPPLYLVLSNLYQKQGNALSMLAALEQFLKLAPEGPMSDQARATKAQVEKYLANQTKNGTPKQ